MAGKQIRLLRIFLLTLFLALAGFQTGHGQFQQPPERVYEEAQTVYLGNLARRQHGVGPLRWNWPLTQAGRWFSWDSVVNRPGGYCGHQDTNGEWPGDRARHFGYLGGAGAENAFCGYVTPQAAIDGWLNSPGHRANLLDPGHRELGLGYYVRDSDGRGYVTQGFGADAVYPPVVIENEAPQTTTPNISLYIYDRAPGAGFSEMGAATEMLVSNTRCFKDAAWQPYQTEIPWTLQTGTGWRQVFVKTRDRLQRTAMVADSIYLGANLPLAELGPAQMSAGQESVTLHNINSGGRPLMQFSLSWRVADSYGTFSKLWGNGQTVNDPQALGGTAFRMVDGDGTTSAWVWTTEFIRDTPMIAYVRLKTSNNSAAGEIASIEATNGQRLALRGVDFLAANQYQEFPVAFNFRSADDFLIFQFNRTAAADVYVDAITIFTVPQPVVSPFTWSVPGGNYRGQGIWLRTTDGGDDFSPIEEVQLYSQALTVEPGALRFLAGLVGPAPAPQRMQVQDQGCGPIAYHAGPNAAWLKVEPSGSMLRVGVDLSGLTVGDYSGEITLTPDDPENGSPVTVPVSLRVVAELFPLRLPLLFDNQ